MTRLEGGVREGQILPAQKQPISSFGALQRPPDGSSQRTPDMDPKWPPIDYWSNYSIGHYWMVLGWNGLVRTSLFFDSFSDHNNQFIFYLTLAGEPRNALLPTENYLQHTKLDTATPWSGSLGEDLHQVSTTLLGWFGKNKIWIGTLWCECGEIHSKNPIVGESLRIFARWWTLH